MKVYLKDGTILKITEKNHGDARADMNVDGYVCIEKLDEYEKAMITRVVIPKENVAFVDMENDEESGITMKILAMIK